MTLFYLQINLDTSKYPNKKFIFGPHFSVFPNNKLYEIKNINNRCCIFTT